MSRPLLAQDEGRPQSGSSDLSALVARQQLRMDTLESSLKDIRGTIEVEFRDIRVQLEQLAASALAEQSETSVDVKQFQSEMTRFGDAIEILNQRISRTLELTSDVEFRVLRLEKRMQTLMSLWQWFDRTAGPTGCNSGRTAASSQYRPGCRYRRDRLEN